MAVLGALYRHGEHDARRAGRPRARAAAEHDPHRQLPRGGRLRRTPPARHRRPPGRREPLRQGPRRRCSPTGARRDAWLAKRLRELTADERAAAPPGRPHPRTTRPDLTDPRTDTLSPTFRSLHNPNYRLYAAGCAGVERRHLDAARRPGLAGPPARRPTAAPPSASPPACSSSRSCCSRPVAGLVADRVPKRRLLQVTNLGMAVPAILLGAARDHRPRRALARLRARVRARHRRRPSTRPPGSRSCPRWSRPTT